MAINDVGNNFFEDSETGQRVDRNHPIYQQWVAKGLVPGASGGAPAGGSAGLTGSAVPGAEAPLGLPGQAAAASGVSRSPLAAPTGPTANQGTQDVVRNSWLSQATQNRVPEANDPAIRRPADAFAANVDRGVRNQIADAAEANGPTATGANRGVARMAQERGAATSGQFEAELVRREMDARRQEIQAALQGLSGFIGDDQRMALQRELAQLSAQLSRAGLDQSASQHADRLGFDVASREADLDMLALRYLTNGGV